MGVAPLEGGSGMPAMAGVAMREIAEPVLSIGEPMRERDGGGGIMGVFVRVCIIGVLEMGVTALD